MTPLYLSMLLCRLYLYHVLHCGILNILSQCQYHFQNIFYQFVLYVYVTCIFYISFYVIVIFVYITSPYHISYIILYKR